MSKTIGANLKAHFEAETATYCILWRITRQDSVVFGFTDHDKDVVYSGVRYQAGSGFLPTALDQKIDLSVDNLEAISFLESDRVSVGDVLAGLFDYATLDMYVVNYEDLTMGDMILAEGWILGEVRLEEDKFIAEVRSKSQKLQQEIVDVSSIQCRAALGDTQCGVDVPGSYTVVGTITKVPADANTIEFYDSGRAETTDYFTGGKVTFTSGDNNTYSMEVKEYDPSTKKITLFLPMPYKLLAGVTYSMTYGCDKSKNTCINTFNNVVNFRGEPFVPGEDRTLVYEIPIRE
jgi:uncharacterized phage protein (TIGR02218 family)